jgi:hypothetical protein
MAWRAETPCGAFGFGHCEWNGLLSSVTNANGLVAKYAYDVMDRVTNIAWRTTGGAALGAALCMRSKSVNGHANQCCYDKCGKLITHGSGSGSADYAPGEFATFFEHREKDMFPADWAKKLDGGIWGGCSEAYLLRRPEKGAEKCPRNP